MARVYLYLLFLTEVLVVASTLLFQIRAWLHPALSVNQLTQGLPVAGFVLALATAFLAADRTCLTRLLQSSPAWVRFFVGSSIAYAFLGPLLHSALEANTATDPENLFVITAITLALETLALGILQAVLWGNVVQESELVERCRNSIIAASLLCGYLAARHLGLFAPQQRVEMP